MLLLGLHILTSIRAYRFLLFLLFLALRLFIGTISAVDLESLSQLWISHVIWLSIVMRNRLFSDHAMGEIVSVLIRLFSLLDRSRPACKVCLSITRVSGSKVWPDRLEFNLLIASLCHVSFLGAK